MANAQINDSSSVYHNAIKLELTHGGIEYDRRIQKKTSINIATRIGYPSIFNDKKHDVAFAVDYRYYFANDCSWPLGFYIGGLTYYKNFIVEREADADENKLYSRSHIKVAGFGIKMGMKREIVGNLFYEVHAGVGYNFYRDIKELEGNQPFGENKFRVSMVGILSLGYRF